MRQDIAATQSARRDGHPEGQALHRHAIELVANLERLALAVDDMQAIAGGVLRLCANPSALGGFLPAVLAAYAARHPDVKIDLHDALSEEAVRTVLTGAAELAVIGDNTPREDWKPSSAISTRWC